MCDRHGRHAIGELKDMHPLALKMIRDFSPNSTAAQRPYDQAIKTIAPYYGVSPDTLSATATPKQFQDAITAFATGMQYVAKKFGGSINVSDYEITDVLPGGFKQFGAAADPGKKKIYINPHYILHHIDPDKLHTADKVTGDFTGYEILVLTGVEEMLHLQQYQTHGKTASYSLHRFNEQEYRNDPVEKEAEVLCDVACRELSIGPKYRSTPERSI